MDMHESVILEYFYSGFKPETVSKLKPVRTLDEIAVGDSLLILPRDFRSGKLKLFREITVEMFSRFSESLDIVKCKITEGRYLPDTRSLDYIKKEASFSQDYFDGVPLLIHLGLINEERVYKVLET